MLVGIRIAPHADNAVGGSGSRVIVIERESVVERMLPTF